MTTLKAIAIFLAPPVLVLCLVVMGVIIVTGAIGVAVVNQFRKVNREGHMSKRKEKSKPWPKKARDVIDDLTREYKYLQDKFEKAMTYWEGDGKCGCGALLMPPSCPNCNFHD